MDMRNDRHRKSERKEITGNSHQPPAHSSRKAPAKSPTLACEVVGFMFVKGSLLFPSSSFKLSLRIWGG